MESIQLKKKFPLHSRIQITGSSNSGKSVVVKNLIQFRDEMFEGPSIDTVLFFYMVKDDTNHRLIRDMVSNVKFYQGLGILDSVLKEHELEAQDRGIIVVLEDLQLEAFRSKDVALLFTAHAHHLPLSAVLYTTQSPYQRNAPFQALINRNLTHLICTNSPRLRSVLPFIGRELDPRNPDRILRIFDEALSGKHGEPFPLLLVDMTASDPNQMFFAGIFPGQKFRIFREVKNDSRKSKE